MSLIGLLAAACGTPAAPLPPTPTQTSGQLAITATKVTVQTDDQHNGFPGLCISDTSTGELMAAWRTGTTHLLDYTAKFEAKWSSDGGRTWSTNATTIYDPAGTDPRDVCLTKLADGRIAMTAFQYTEAGDYTSEVLFSSDNGRTFGTPVPIAQTLLTRVDAVTGPVVECTNGDLIVPLYGDSAVGEKQSAICVRSTDGGATWGNATMIASGPATIGNTWGPESEGEWYEPFMIRLGTAGHIYCGLRHSREKFWYATSTDHGATWSNPTNTGIVGYARPAVQRIAATGAIAMNNRSQYQAQVRTSHDNGATWTAATVVSEGTGGYGMAYAQMQENESGYLAHLWAQETTDALHAAVYFGYIYDENMPDPPGF